MHNILSDAGQYWLVPCFETPEINETNPAFSNMDPMLDHKSTHSAGADANTHSYALCLKCVVRVLQVKLADRLCQIRPVSPDSWALAQPI